MPTTATPTPGYRAADPRITRDPEVWWATAYCSGCSYLVWIRESERADGRAVRCTVCLAAEGVATVPQQQEHDV